MRYNSAGSVNSLGKFFYSLFLTADSFKLCIVSLLDLNLEINNWNWCPVYVIFVKRMRSTLLCYKKKKTVDEFYILKVLSHQIRSAWKWHSWLALRIADGTQTIKCRRVYFLNLNLSYLSGIAYMIDAVWNYRIPQTNLHAGLNFEHIKNLSVEVLIFEPFFLLVSTVVQNVLSLPE
jgi:hypothetical protein